MQSNEALAILVRQGDKCAAAQLWEQVHRLIIKISMPYFAYCDKYGQEQDDLIQCGYFAMLRAVEAYDSSKEYAFTAYLSHHVRNVIHEELGWRGHAGRPRTSVSLDAPMTGEEANLTLMDSLQDEAAIEAFEAVEDSVYRQHVRDIMDECLAGQPELVRRALYDRFYGGMSFCQIAEDNRVSYKRLYSSYEKGLRALRRYRRIRELEEYREHQIHRNRYRSYGLSAFREYGSGVEQAVLRREELTKRHNFAKKSWI